MGPEEGCRAAARAEALGTMLEFMNFPRTNEWAPPTERAGFACFRRGRAVVRGPAERAAAVAPGRGSQQREAAAAPEARPPESEAGPAMRQNWRTDDSSRNGRAA